MLVCKNCGQHYLEGYYRNFSLSDGKLNGSDLEGNNAIWEATDETGGQRVLFTNRFTSEMHIRVPGDERVVGSGSGICCGPKKA